ncbi:hypothetical protein A9Q94_16455, partial [Rhodobacterales bacterium 56_14_T64]
CVIKPLVPHARHGNQEFASQVHMQLPLCFNVHLALKTLIRTTKITSATLFGSNAAIPDLTMTRQAVARKGGRTATSQPSPAQCRTNHNVTWLLPHSSASRCA